MRERERDGESQIFSTGAGSYLGRCLSDRPCHGDASLDRQVTARGRDGDRHRGGEEGGDDRQREEPRPVVAIDDGAGVVGPAIVEAGGPDVSAFPGHPVVPLEAVVVSRHHFLCHSEGMMGASLRDRQERRHIKGSFLQNSGKEETEERRGVL